MSVLLLLLYSGYNLIESLVECTCWISIKVVIKSIYGGFHQRNTISILVKSFTISLQYCTFRKAVNKLDITYQEFEGC